MDVKNGNAVLGGRSTTLAEPVVNGDGFSANFINGEHLILFEDHFITFDSLESKNGEGQNSEHKSSLASTMEPEQSFWDSLKAWLHSEPESSQTRNYSMPTERHVPSRAMRGGSSQFASLLHHPIITKIVSEREFSLDPSTPDDDSNVEKSWLRLDQEQIDQMKAKGQNLHRSNHQHSYTVTPTHGRKRLVAFHADQPKLEFHQIDVDDSSSIESFPADYSERRKQKRKVLASSSSFDNSQSSGATFGQIDHLYVQKLRRDQRSRLSEQLPPTTHGKHHRHSAGRSASLSHRRSSSVSKSGDPQSLISFWKDMVIPQWNVLRHTPYVIKVWRSYGVPPEVRNRVWPLAIGNKSHVSPDAFNKYAPPTLHDDENEEMSTSSPYYHGKSRRKSIDADINRMYPGANGVNGAYLDEGEKRFLNNLKEVLLTFCNYCPESSYVQGMAYLASMFLLYMDCKTAFECLVNILLMPHIADYIDMRVNNIRKRFEIFELMLADNLPNLHIRFKSMKINCDVYLMEWVLTLYTKQLPLPLASRVWDMYLLEGEVLLFKTAVAILAILSHQLLNFSQRNCIRLLRHIPDDLCTEDQLMEVISRVRVCPAVRDFYDEQETLLKKQLQQNLQENLLNTSEIPPSHNSSDEAGDGNLSEQEDKHLYEKGNGAPKPDDGTECFSTDEIVNGVNT